MRLSLHSAHLRRTFHSFYKNVWVSFSRALILQHCVFNERYILTSTNCNLQFKKNLTKIVAYIGSLNLYKVQQQWDIAEIIVPEEYGAPNYHHDIALIRTTEKMEFSTTAQPINLPASDYINANTLLSSGFGIRFVSWHLNKKKTYNIYRHSIIYISITTTWWRQCIDQMCCTTMKRQLSLPTNVPQCSPAIKATTSLITKWFARKTSMDLISLMETPAMLWPPIILCMALHRGRLDVKRTQMFIRKFLLKNNGLKILWPNCNNKTGIGLSFKLITRSRNVFKIYILNKMMILMQIYHLVFYLFQLLKHTMQRCDKREPVIGYAMWLSKFDPDPFKRNDAKWIDLNEVVVSGVRRVHMLLFCGNYHPSWDLRKYPSAIKRSEWRRCKYFRFNARLIGRHPILLYGWRLTTNIFTYNLSVLLAHHWINFGLI